MQGLNIAAIYNKAPSPSKLENGDVKYKIDFRDVYATLLDKWLNVNKSQVLTKNFAGLRFG